MSENAACVVCTKEVRLRQQRLDCDKCGRWQHRTYDSGVAQVTYRRFTRVQITLDFLCRDCKRKTSTDGTRPSTPPIFLAAEHSLPVRVSPAVNVGHSLDSIQDQPNLKDECIQETAIGESSMEIEEEQVAYRIVDRGTQRGGRMLTDNQGFCYTVKRVRNGITNWWCSVMSKAMRCPASVNQRGEEFTEGKKEHVHPPLPRINLVLQVKAYIKTAARSNIQKSSRSVVEAVLQDQVDLDASEAMASLPNEETLIRIANRSREHLRPKVPPKFDTKSVQKKVWGELDQKEIGTKKLCKVCSVTATPSSITADSNIN